MCQKHLITELNAKDIVQLNGMDIATILFKGEKVKASLKLFEWDSNNNILTLKIRSFSEFRRRYYNQIQFPDIAELKKAVAKEIEIDKERWFPSTGREGQKNIVYEEPFNPYDEDEDIKINWQNYRLLEHDIKLYCSCPSFQYYRSFQLTQYDAAIYPENRPPIINDPSLERVWICHHLYATLQFALWMEPYIKNFIRTHEKVPLELAKQKLTRKTPKKNPNDPTTTTPTDNAPATDIYSGEPNVAMG